VYTYSIRSPLPSQVHAPLLGLGKHSVDRRAHRRGGMHMVVDPALAIDAGLMLPDPATALGLPVGFMLGLLGGCAQPSNKSPWENGCLQQAEEHREQSEESDEACETRAEREDLLGAQMRAQEAVTRLQCCPKSFPGGRASPRF